MGNGKSLRERADRFIGLANACVEQGLEPNEVAEGMLFATARYMAFMTHGVVLHGMGEKEGEVKRLCQTFKEMVEHHLDQMEEENTEQAHGHECGDPGCGHDHGQGFGQGLGQVQDDEVEEQVSKLSEQLEAAMDPLMRSYSSMDVALGAYLRGIGQAQVADRLAVSWARVQHDQSWDLEYSARVHEELENKTLSEDLAVAVVMNVLMPRMIELSGGGYLPDPVMNEESRKALAEFFARVGLHKLATMARKDIARLVKLGNEGDSRLLGERSDQMRRAINAARARKQH